VLLLIAYAFRKVKVEQAASTEESMEPVAMK
jgi:hypothetical protein